MLLLTITIVMMLVMPNHHLKKLLITEYNDSIGFKQRNVKNKSVCAVGGGFEYMDDAMSSLGICDEELIQHLAPRLLIKIRETHSLQWSPQNEQLEKRQ